VKWKSSAFAKRKARLTIAKIASLPFTVKSLHPHQHICEYDREAHPE
jgi:hypothetical protein